MDNALNCTPFTEITIPSFRFEELIAKEERLLIVESIVGSESETYGDYSVLKKILGFEVHGDE